MAEDGNLFGPSKNKPLGQVIGAKLKSPVSPYDPKAPGSADRFQNGIASAHKVVSAFDESEPANAFVQGAMGTFGVIATLAGVVTLPVTFSGAIAISVAVGGAALVKSAVKKKFNI